MTTGSTDTTKKRVENKYIVKNTVLKAFLKDLEPYMVADKYKHSTITNIYYDTDDFEIIRHSISKPKFKEKFRIRTYDSNPTETSQVFMEIKTKNEGVVYKDRFQTDFNNAEAYFAGEEGLEDEEFQANMDEFLKRYPDITPKMYIYYDRLSMKAKDNNKIRLTVDSNLIFREENAGDVADKSGENLLDPNLSIVEIKLNTDEPEWLQNILEKHHIEEGSFSKYGTAYKIVKGLLEREE